MWSYFSNKENQRWLWYAIDHESGELLAYVLGRRGNKVFLKLITTGREEPFGISCYLIDDWGSYKRQLKAQEHEIGKRNTQKIE